MSLQRLEKMQWQSFCSYISKEISGKPTEIEIASEETGVQLEAQWLPLVELAYDPRSDVLEIVLEGLDHLVAHPQEFYVDFGLSGLESLGIVDRDRVWQIVLFREPLKLPAPHAL
jgi:hypothetical protein